MDYKSKRWQQVRKRILMKDGYKDVLAKRYGKMVEASTVHHIYPADKYPEYEWEDWNLISVSHKTHNSLHDRITNELTAEGQRLMKRTLPGVDWRKKTHSTK